MERKRSLVKTISLYMILELGALVGVPMRPDDIERMTRQLNDAVVQVVEDRERDGDPPDPPEPPGPASG